MPKTAKTRVARHLPLSPAASLTDNAAIERQMHYLCETNARMSELKIRTKNAKHWIGRRLPAYADDELMHLAYEAEKLRLHLRAWNDYVSSSPNTVHQPTPAE